VDAGLGMAHPPHIKKWCIFEKKFKAMYFGFFFFSFYVV
jgi:hypothetical protein